MFQQQVTKITNKIAIFNNKKVLAKNANKIAIFQLQESIHQKH